MTERGADMAGGRAAARGARVQVTVNGRRREVDDGMPLRDLLADLGLTPQGVAVERNGAVVPRSALATVTLTGGDRLEIIRAVAGG